MRNAERKGGLLCFNAHPKNLNALMQAARSAGFIGSFKLGPQAHRPGYGVVRHCETIEADGKSLLKFVTGDWLEIYAWRAAAEAGGALRRARWSARKHPLCHSFPILLI